MKIGFLVGSISREAGGLFQSVQGLAKTIMSLNTALDVFAIQDKHSAVDAANWRPVPVHLFAPRFRAWSYSERLLPALLDANLDVLFTHGLWTYCSVASDTWHRRTRKSYIIHPHGMLDAWALRQSRWKKKIAGTLYENRHLREATCLRALCEEEAHSMRAYGLHNPICVIPNGVELPATLANSKFGFTEGTPVLLYLGRLHPKKNLVALLKAWLELRNSAQWILAIAGWDQGGYEAQLKKLATDQELATTVKFLGPLFGEQRDAAYRACDAFILPSLSEGLPMTVLEAWAYAKPVLMTPECNLMEGFAAGAALQIGTRPEEIAGGLKQLTEMTNDNRKAMGARGRALVAEKFSWPRIGQRMRTVYEWVLGGGAPPETVRLD